MAVEVKRRVQFEVVIVYLNRPPEGSMVTGQQHSGLKGSWKSYIKLSYVTGAFYKCCSHYSAI